MPAYFMNTDGMWHLDEKGETVRIGEPVRISYAFRWTERSGTINGVQAQPVPLHDLDARRDAWFGCLKSAIMMGWTPVRWWQWWRSNDQPRNCRLPPELKPTE